MSGGVLGVAGDILSFAFFCFICSLAIQLYCAFSRRATPRPPTPVPSTISSPVPPAAASKQMHVSRFQRSASCPVVSAIAPPSSPPNKLSSAFHTSAVGCSINFSPSPLACSAASQAHVADLAKLMRLESAQEQDVDAESFICVPPQRQLFTIKEEGRDEDATEQSDVANGTSAEASEPMCAVVELSSQAREGPLAKWTSATCGHALAAGLIVSQVSSVSSEGGVSLWSTSPSPSSSAVSYLSACSSPFPTSSPPRSSSFSAQTSRFSNAMT